MKQPLEVQDYKGRVARLVKNYGYMVAGSRYITRASVRNVLTGKSVYLKGGSEAVNAVTKRRAHATHTRLRIGCHVFTGQNFKIIQKWALNQ